MMPIFLGFGGEMIFVKMSRIIKNKKVVPTSYFNISEGGVVAWEWWRSGKQGTVIIIMIAWGEVLFGVVVWHSS